jgi:hypothetical protein
MYILFQVILDFGCFNQYLVISVVHLVNNPESCLSASSEVKSKQTKKIRQVAGVRRRIRLEIYFKSSKIHEIRRHDVEFCARRFSHWQNGAGIVTPGSGFESSENLS